VASSGRLDDEAAYWGEAHGVAENRLLGWDENVVWAESGLQSDWSQRDWLFALPLRVLEDPKAVQQQLITPIVQLLCRPSPEIALKDWKAVVWNAAQPVLPMMSGLASSGNASSEHCLGAGFLKLTAGSEACRSSLVLVVWQSASRLRSAPCLASRLGL
jgi:hypothetical protein